MKAEIAKDPLTGEVTAIFKYNWTEIVSLDFDKLDRAILSIESDKPSGWALQLATLFRKAGM